jgi:uracil-DNA glycosylase family protein
LPAHSSASVRSLRQLAEAEASCTRCPLYRDATQVMPGEGPTDAVFMLVGEQPGDKEDLAGRPFVGPAGRKLDQALEDAGIERTETFVTKAVKHFKHEMRSKRRLHKRPDNYEIERCKIWLDLETQSGQAGYHWGFGRHRCSQPDGPHPIGKVHGKPIAMADGTCLIVTIHPSALLRIEDDDERDAAYRSFVADLKAARAVHGLTESGRMPSRRIL